MIKNIGNSHLNENTSSKVLSSCTAAVNATSGISTLNPFQIGRVYRDDVFPYVC